MKTRIYATPAVKGLKTCGAVRHDLSDADFLNHDDAVSDFSLTLCEYKIALKHTYAYTTISKFCKIDVVLLAGRCEERAARGPARN